MDTMYPAATFTATRDELVGPEPLLGAAEIARGVCRVAERTVSVLAVTSERMRRIDGWLGPIGFVTHAAAPETQRAVLGSVCDRDRAYELVDEIIVSLVGALPETASSVAVDLDALESLSPDTMPVGIDWIVVVTTTSTRHPHDPARTVITASDGLAMGVIDALDRPARLVPVDVEAIRDTLTAVLGPAARSVRDVLSDD